MQRFHATSSTSAIGGVPARDRGDPSSLSSNFSINQRRQPQPAVYKLRCDKEPLNSRLGPPDFNPPTPNCPEETLNREYAISGYRETVEGLEEAREISLSQVQTFSKPVVLKCKEAIRKCHRAINESRAQKRKAGQVYGVPLSGQLLTKPGVFPEQRQCGEDSRRKWIEGLSQPHKRLRSLAEQVPHGYRKKTLFEVLIKNNVPLLRATWFIKVTYLNQVRPISAGISSGVPDKNRVSRTEQWTKDIIDYLQCLLDEFVSRPGIHTSTHIRDRLPQVTYNSLQQNNDPVSAVPDGAEPTLHFKWWYLVRIVQWHHVEGLLQPSLIIDWVLSQLKEKNFLGNLQLLLPILCGIMGSVVLSQTYVRAVVELAVRFIQAPSPGGNDLVDNSRRAYTISVLVEMLRYMIQTVPDTFVALDCFALPSGLISYVVNEGHFLSKEGTAKTNILLKDKGPEAQCRSLAVSNTVSSIQQRAGSLALATKSGYPSHNVGKALQELDKTLVRGDCRNAYNFLFDDLHNGDIDEHWMEGVSPSLRSSMNWRGSVHSSSVSSVLLLCEWATCVFRDFRTASPHGMKFTGKKVFSQVYLAVRILKLKIDDLQRTRQSKNGPHQQNNSSMNIRRKRRSNSFESPGPIHDIIVCWIDQHEVHNGEGYKRLQLLIVELIRARIFCPQAYVRQLIVSGIMDSSGPTVDLNRKRRHYKVLKHLPGPSVSYLLEEAQTSEVPLLGEAMNVYSNERRLLLQSLTLSRHSKRAKANSLPMSGKILKRIGELEELKESISVLLQFPSSSAATGNTSGDNESQGSVKKILGPTSNKVDRGEGTPGCEECIKAKRPKSSEERNTYLRDYSPNPSDEEDTWWMRKGMKPLDVLKTDPPVTKPVKQSSRGRQKVVRKTQSLAHLAAARIEGSQGASTSHVCDNRVSCPHHKASSEGEFPKSKHGSKTLHSGDIVLIGEKLKQLRFVEKKIVAVWLVNSAKQLIEDNKRDAAKVGQYGSLSFPSVDNKSSVQWKLGEDELSAILYLIDISDDLVSAATFLVWLLPKALSSSSSTVHGGRNVLMLPRNVGSHVCQVGEAFLLSSIRRYENILVANDLVPETLSVMMQRVATLMVSNGKVSGLAALPYARYVLRKYSGLPGVDEWETNFKATCDKRLIPELQSGRSLDGELGFPLGVPAGVEDLDDFLRQKISGVRVSRVGMSMREVVQRHVEEAFQYFCGKERKICPPNTMKSPSLEKVDDGYQFVQQIVVSIMDCMRQTGGAAQEGEPTLVSSAVSAIVGSISQVLAKLPDFSASGTNANISPTMTSLTLAQRILRFHVTCLSLLKEALGDRQSRVFEIALAVEASLSLSQALAPVKTNEISNSSLKTVSGRVVKTTAAVSSLVLEAILHGVASLERMVTVFRLKEGLDVIQFARSSRSNSNGNARSGGVKADDLAVVSVHWFRVLVGNCRTVCDGLIVELLGEASVVAISRMQRALPLSLVLPPAYSIFAFVMWRPFLFNPNIVNREGIHQLSQSCSLAISEVIKHRPFRDACLRDTSGLYDLLAADPTDSEFASMLELNGAEKHIKKMAFVPLRARLFLNAVIDCKLPAFVSTQEDAKRAFAENDPKLLDKLVHILDTLQPAKFHWQWVELRLLLNEQALLEKLESHDNSMAESIRTILNPNKAAVSENENNFIEIILTRLLVRPDAAGLFSEIIHLFGKSLEDSMLLQVKWFLKGSDVLFGRKSIRQRLVNIAESKGLSIKHQFQKPFGWCSPDPNIVTSKGNKRKFESISIEEGEVVEKGTDSKRSVKGPNPGLDAEDFNSSQQYVTERALVELVLSCIDQSSDEARNIFASDLIKQMTDIEQQINSVTCGALKQVGTVGSGIEGTTSKSSGRKATRGGCSASLRRQTVTADMSLPTPVTLRASMTLRLHFLLKLLPIIWADGEPSVRNMRYMLASVVLRLLGSRVVYEDADMSSFTASSSSPKNMDFSMEDLSSGSLFDRLLLMLYGLLSSYRPSWLRTQKESSSFDRDVAASLQNDLDRMPLPDAVRWRIQAAMPTPSPSYRCSISCQPPSVPPAAISSLQPIISSSGSLPKTGNNKSTPAQQQDGDFEIDPWTLLEDGAGSGSGQSLTSAAAISGNDNGTFRATSWLKGAVRMRRTDLTYIGTMDEDI